MLKGRSLRACAALVAFCCSLLLVSISPVSADDTSDYLLGYWTFSARDSTWGDSFLAGLTPPSDYSIYSGVNSLPFRGKNIGTGKSPGDYKVGSYIVGAGALQTAGFYPDVTISSGFSSPQVGHNLHLILKMGVGVGAGSVSHRDDSMYGFWFVGDRAYTSSNAKITFIGTSAWSTGLDLSFSEPFEGANKVYSDYTSGYCYRLDFDYQAEYGNTDKYAISGLGLYFVDYTSRYTTASNRWIGGLVGYVLAWADTGVAAIDDAITNILTHVAKIDGNVQNIYTTLKSLLAVAKEIGIDTDTMVKLLTTINSNVALLQSDVSGIYELLKTALADESAELDKKTEQAAESIMQRTDSEQYWSDKNQDNFNALNIDNFSFGDGVVSALGTVGGLFSGLWDALGDGIIVYTFPLMLGVALVLVGRLARSSGKGHNKSDSGGDDK